MARPEVGVTLSAPHRERDARLIAMPDNFLDCRQDRHALLGQSDVQRWRYRDADVIERRVACARCGSVQIRQVVESSRQFEAGSLYKPTTYEYVTGYLNPMPGTGRIPNNAVRLEAARRFLDRNPLPIRRRELS
jgi:hypothetical protein